MLLVSEDVYDSWNVVVAKKSEMEQRSILCLSIRVLCSASISPLLHLFYSLITISFMQSIWLKHR